MFQKQCDRKDALNIDLDNLDEQAILDQSEKLKLTDNHKASLQKLQNLKRQF